MSDSKSNPSNTKKPSSQLTPSQLMILDGHGLAYRSYYALEQQDLRDPHTQERTHAIHGFFGMLIRLLKKFSPSHLVITWDTRAPTFRKKIFPDYKAGRKPIPPDLPQQITRIQELATRCGFCNQYLDSYEADDVIGTLASTFCEALPILIVSSDKDCFQLLNDRVAMIRPMRGIQEFDLINPEWVQKNKGVPIDQIRDYFALTGDSADNILGVPGIGPKTAAKLLQQFSSLEKIYESLHQVGPASTQKKLLKGKDSAFLSRELFTIDRKVPIVWPSSPKDPLAQTLFPVPIPSDGIKKFRQDGFQQISNQMEKLNAQSTAAQSSSSMSVSSSGASNGGNKNTHDQPKPNVEPTRLETHHAYLKKEKQYKMIASLPELQDLIKKMLTDLPLLEPKNFLAIDTETTGLDTSTADLIGISLSYQAQTAYYIPLRPPRLAAKLQEQNPDPSAPFAHQFLPYEAAKKILSNFLSRPELRFVGQNIRYDLRILNAHGFPISWQQTGFDTMIASYLCLPNMRRHNLTDMTRIWLKQDKLNYEDVLTAESKKKSTNFSEVAPKSITAYACEDADITWQLYEYLSQELKKKKLAYLFAELEIPLLFVLMEMEEIGVCVDLDYLEKLKKDFSSRRENHQKNIHDIVGFSFNILSTRELQKVLFENLKMPLPRRKIKSGLSIDHQALEELRRMQSVSQDQRTVIDEIIEFRRYSKLISTYVDKLIDLADEENRVHTSFSQTVAATGRLSSFHPNLQNIPRRETSGRSIRRAFIAAKNCQLLAADYSQIELRILAHFSRDENLIQCYADPSAEVDVHRKTAAALFDSAEKDISAAQRNIGKVLNFSILYGATEFGISKSLNIPMPEAKDLIKRFFLAYPKVKEYIDRTIEQAKEKGFVSTLMGRIRPTPDVRNAPKIYIRKAAERVAVNAPIQGTSADIIKLAMIRISHHLAGSLQTRMLLQVHDELLFEVPHTEKEQVLPLIKKEMEGAAELTVPLLVKYGWGDNWDEAQHP